MRTDFEGFIYFLGKQGELWEQIPAKMKEYCIVTEDDIEIIQAVVELFIDDKNNGITRETPFRSNLLLTYLNRIQETGRYQQITEKRGIIMVFYVRYFEQMCNERKRQKKW